MSALQDRKLFKKNGKYFLIFDETDSTSVRVIKIICYDALSDCFVCVRSSLQLSVCTSDRLRDGGIVLPWNGMLHITCEGQVKVDEIQNHFLFIWLLEARNTQAIRIIFMQPRPFLLLRNS